MMEPRKPGRIPARLVGGEMLILAILALIAGPIGHRVWAQAPGGETLSEPRRGVVQNVPTADPYYGNLVIRQGPSLQTPSIGFVSNGDEVTIVGTSGSFMQISSPKSGFVWASYLKITEWGQSQIVPGQDPLPLETIVNNTSALSIRQNLQERQQLLPDEPTLDPGELGGPAAP
jgi:hypothetical protein